MDEDEVSLKEYINVIKKEKILILSIFLVAVASAAVFSFLLPDEYSSEAKLSYITNQKISITDIPEILKSQPIIQKTAAQGDEREALSILSNLKVENIKNTNQIQIQLQGTKPELMEKYFGQYIKVAVDELNRKSFEKSQSDYTRLENLSTVYMKQREDVEAKMKTKLAEDADLEIKRLRNLSVIAARFQSTDRLMDLEFKISELTSIKDGRISSSLAQQMIQSSQELSLLHSQLDSIDARLVDLETKKLESENLNSDVVELITPPTYPVVVGPKRSLNIAIAAVLGLFIGVFAAFFKNYMEESASN